MGEGGRSETPETELSRPLLLGWAGLGCAAGQFRRKLNALHDGSEAGTLHPAPALPQGSAPRAPWVCVGATWGQP